jgi:hypothetical protein
MSPTQSVELPKRLEAILQDVARKARECDQGPYYLEVCKIIIIVERYLDRALDGVDPSLCMLHGDARNCTAIHACLIAHCPFAKAKLQQWTLEKESVEVRQLGEIPL